MEQKSYSSDAPIYDPSLDQFNRYPFAKRVASVISKRSDPSSIVIGIYGAWGEGKTSVFNFIENELIAENVVCFRFNPWRFGDEDQMLINFFKDLATIIDKTIESGREKIGDIIGRYGKPLASLFGKGEAAEGVASFFSEVDIIELRERIEKLLEKEKKRIVILIDDIDRLEKDEIHAVFRLVKLTADFKYTAYILAFDKIVVSAALQERYGATDTLGTGNSFLEKIIQVPLQLPSVDNEDLRSFCFSEIDQVMKLFDIQLSESEVREFVGYFSKGLECHLKTPRQAKLYSNILMFSLPILKGEAYVVDLMLIEGIRVLLPNVYSLIRDQQELFLKGKQSGYGSQYEQKEKEKTRRKERIENVLREFTIEEKENIIDLLCFLFPKLNEVFNNYSYSNDWELQWSEKQRLSSPQYFQRYFTYAVTKKDVSDIALNELIEYSNLHPTDDVISKIETIMTDKNSDTFISKLRRKSKSFTPAQSKSLAVSIAKLGNTLPNPVQLFRSWNTFGQGAMFISDCIVNLENKQEQIALGKEVIHSADSLSFAVECFSWFNTDTEEEPNIQGFSIKEYKILAEFLAGKISTELKNKENSWIENIDYLPSVLRIWSEYGRTAEAYDSIQEKLQKDEKFVFTLLDSFTGTSFGEFGTKKSSLRRENYDTIIELIDPNIIIEAIENAFGYIQLEGQYPEYLDVSRNEELSRQFLWIHAKVRKAKENDTHLDKL
jgi:KAP family P-loop domain